MEVALPRRQAAVVGRPDGLERDGGRAPARGRPELVGLEVPLLLQDGIGQADGGFGPVRPPPGQVGGEVAGHSPLQGPGGLVRGQLGVARFPPGNGGVVRIARADAPGPREHPVVGHVPVGGHLVAHAAPALLMVADGGLLGDELGLRVAQPGQRARGQGIRGAPRPGGRRGVGGGNELGSLPGRPTFELEPADGLRGLDEGGQPGAILPSHPADGFGQGQPHGLDLAEPRDVELEGRGRDLGRRGIAVVGLVAHAVDGPVVVPEHVVADPREPELGAGEFGHGAQVPEVGPVEGQAQDPALLPDQGPDEAVPQGDTLVPGRRETFEDEVVARRGVGVLVPGRSARRRQRQGRQERLEGSGPEDHGDRLSLIRPDRPPGRRPRPSRGCSRRGRPGRRGPRRRNRARAGAGTRASRAGPAGRRRRRR